MTPGEFSRDHTMKVFTQTTRLDDNILTDKARPGVPWARLPLDALGDDDEVKKTKESDGGGDSDMHETDALYDAVLEHVVHSPGHAAYTFPR